MKKIIGTHNTMTFLSPKKWWMRPFQIFSKCQTKNLIEQWENGVRCFDLRVYYDSKTESWLFAHGLTKFDASYNIIDVINKLYALSVESNDKKDEPIYIRIILERTKDTNIETYYFSSLCKKIEKAYDKCSNVTFLGGYRKKDWYSAYNFNGNSIPVEQYVGSMASDARFYEKILPKAYANRKNEENKNKLVQGINLFDFI